MNFASRECVKRTGLDLPPTLAITPAGGSAANRGAGNLFGGIGHSVTHAPSGAGGPVGVSAFCINRENRPTKIGSSPIKKAASGYVQNQQGRTTPHAFNGPVPPTHFEPVEQTSLDTDIISG